MPNVDTNALNSNRDMVVIFSLSALVLAIYFQTTGFQFINLDDNLYVYQNGAVRTGINWDSVKWAFVAFHSANWHPLTWLSHAADVELFGLEPGGHHSVNVLIHLMNSVLTFGVFKAMTGRFWESAFVAALFAVHPAHVESVAWVSERKDVLSTLFWLSTMWAYHRYTISEMRSDGSASWLTPKYLLVFALFGLGLMAKPMLVTLPFVLLLCDFWPLKRMSSIRELRPLIVEKLPLFLLSALSSVITIVAQRSAGAVEGLDRLPIGTRLANALVSYADYVVMLVYPSNLGVWYPYRQNISPLMIGGSIVLFLLISAFCVWQIRRRYLIVGWLWFLGTLVPVIGLVQVGSQSLADRYTYVPYFGLFIMLVWGISDIIKNLAAFRRPLFAAALGAVLMLSVMAHEQVSYWANNETLYRRTLAVTDRNHLIELNLCYALTMEDRFTEAEPLCLASLESKENFEAYNTLGIIYMKQSRFADAETMFGRAISFAPRNAPAFVNISLAQLFQERPEDAESSLEKAAELNAGEVSPSDFAGALEQLANAFEKQGKYQKSVDNLARLLALSPGDNEARTRLAFGLLKLDRAAEAREQVEAVLRADPKHANAEYTYGLILSKLGRAGEAVQAFENAIRSDPGHTEARAALARAKGEE